MRGAANSSEVVGTESDEESAATNGPRGERPLVPIVVDGIGRDGTTMTMQLLGTSPQIAFDRIYPYEQRYFTYLLEWVGIIERQDWPEDRWRRESVASPWNRGELIGPLPWEDRSLVEPEGEGGRFSERCLRRVWREFSRLAAEHARAAFGHEGGAVIYYAQKYAGSWHLDARGLGAPVVIVPMLRDPRDTWQSYLAFDEKTSGGFLARGENPREVLARFIHGQRTRMRWLLDEREGDAIEFLRYEEMVVDLPGQAAKLEGRLGVSLDAEAVLAQREQLSHHMTSPSPESSIGRWRHEMSPEIQALFEAELAEELTLLGYEV